MRRSSPRVAPVAPTGRSDEQETLLAGVGGDRADNVFATMANHPKLMKRWMVFANHVLAKSTLPARERELVILRIGWLCRSGYEFAQHAVIGLREGITAEELERLKAGPTAEGWGTLDAALLQAADDLHANHDISDPTWSVLSEHLTTEQIMDVVFAAGQYTLVSMALNTFGVQLDDHLPTNHDIPSSIGSERS